MALRYLPSRLEQKPDSALAFVDPILEKTRAGKVTLLVAKRVGPTHAGYQRLVVVAQFFQHVGGAGVVLIVAANALASSDMGDRYSRGAAADLSEPLSDRVRPSSSRLFLAI